MNTSKIIKGVVGGGRYTVTAPIIKEDYGLYLQIEGIELPETYEVDFSNDEHSGTSVTMIGNSDGVLIPSQFIKSGKDVFAFLYHVGDNYGRTVFKFRIPNKLRPDRTDETPTPEEQSTIDQAINALNTAVAKTAQDVVDADESAQSASTDADRAEEARTDAQNYAIQAEQARDDAQTAQGKAEDAQESAERAKDDAETSERNASESERKAKGYADTASEKADAITGLIATATTLPDWSSATASYDAETGVMSFGIPKGKDGTDGTDGNDGYSPTANVSKSGKVATITITDKNGTTSAQVSDGEDGATGATPNLTIGTVETLEPTESATATITGTPENPVLNLGIPQGNTGEVTTEEFLKAFVTDSASGSIASFTDGADNLPLKSLVVNIDPVQDLSQGDPSPENICPISGWTQIGVEQSGVNIWDEEWEVGYLADGQPQPHIASIRSKNFVKCDANAKYYSKFKSTPTLYISVYDKNKNYITRFGGNDAEFTTPVNAMWMKVSCYSYGTTYNHDISINYPSTDHSYHPYIGRSITISLGQTVYGGKLDVLSGELTIDRAMVDLGSKTFTKWANDNNTFACAVPGISTTSQNITCNTYAPLINGVKAWAAILSYDMTIYHPLNDIYLLIRDTRYTDATAFNTSISGVQLVYPLATPITIQLTPNQVNSLLGVNNIWADTGDTSVEYRADTTLYISRLTEPDADMIADANITSGQYFMVGNNLYKATANIASGGQVIVGTNAIRKSLSEALNEINA